jgi:hypothetical protein
MPLAELGQKTRPPAMAGVTQPRGATPSLALRVGITFTAYFFTS